MEQKSADSLRRPRPAKPNLGKIIVPVFFLIIAGLIARQEIPAVDEWIERTLHPDQWSVAKKCNEIAIEQANEKEYARIAASGTIHKTAKGYYVADLVVGERGVTGEHQYRFHCYFDEQQNFVSSGKQE